MLDRPTKPATRWQRNYRRRLKAGVVVVRIEADPALLEFLIRLRWLDAAHVGDKAAIARALAALLADAAAAK